MASTHSRKTTQTRSHSETDEEQLKSSASKNMAFVTFLNNTERKVDVIWINYEGLGIKYKTLEPTDRVDVNTFEGHPWIFRDSFSGDKLIADQQDIFYAQAVFITEETSGWHLRHQRQVVEIQLPGQ